MRYISLFSGIEAASVAWRGLGWEPLAFSEIEPFPCAVLEHHYPNVPNLGDITRVNWRRYRGKCDLIIGGSPCQSFSIAGNREGLAGESGLMFEYIRAVREVRPGWFIWENVPGAFSVEHGEAFKQLLSEMDKLGYGLAWRVLDAQFFGVAQRRRRVFVVGHLGDMRAADVLFEPESMSGDTKPSREKREELARAACVGAAASGFKFHQGAGAGNIGYEYEQSPTLTADWHNPAVMVFDTTQITSKENGSKPDFGRECHSLSASAHVPVIALQSDGTTSLNSNGNGYQDDGSAYTLNCVDKQSVVCIADDNAKAAIDSDLCGSLKVGGGSAVNN